MDALDLEAPIDRAQTPDVPVEIDRPDHRAANLRVAVARLELRLRRCGEREHPVAERRGVTEGQLHAVEAAKVVGPHRRELVQLHDVAAEIATSSRQLQRVFAALAGSSFRDELTAVRMDHAVVLLHRSDRSVAEIVNAVGYRQPAQFAKAFRRHIGVTPSRFRR